MISINYASLYFIRANFLYFIIGSLIAGFYSAYVLIGNHEREIRFADNPQMPYIDHQIATCRNYTHENLFWLLLMGGMQYQTEHHLFPQIPFYRLPSCKNLIKDELSRLNKTLIYGPIL
jgi:acyl-lipid Delta6-acetylenase / acyl-lipid (9-3)-desaturase